MHELKNNLLSNFIFLEIISRIGRNSLNFILLIGFIYSQTINIIKPKDGSTLKDVEDGIRIEWETNDFENDNTDLLLEYYDDNKKKWDDENHKYVKATEPFKVLDFPEGFEDKDGTIRIRIQDTENPKVDNEIKVYIPSLIPKIINGSINFISADGFDDVELEFRKKTYKLPAEIKNIPPNLYPYSATKENYGEYSGKVKVEAKKDPIVEEITLRKTYGLVTFNVNVPDIDLIVEGNRLNQPYSEKYKKGDHIYTARKKGYRTIEKTFSVDASKDDKIISIQLIKEQGSVSITARNKNDFKPIKAIIMVNNEEKTSPAKYSGLNPGTHEGSARMDGYNPEKFEFEIIDNENEEVTVDLLEQNGTLVLMKTRIDQNVKIYIDGGFILPEWNRNKYPIAKIPLSIGNHSIKVEEKGYNTFSKKFKILANKNYPIELKYDPLVAELMSLKIVDVQNSSRSVVPKKIKYRKKGPSAKWEDLYINSLPKELAYGNYDILIEAEKYYRKKDIFELNERAIKKDLKIQLTPKSKAKAGIYSIVPGLGQFYAEKRLKGTGFMGITIGFGYLSAMSINNYIKENDQKNIFKQNYDSLDQTADELAQNADLYKNQVDVVNQARQDILIPTIITISVYLLNLIDAYFISDLPT